MPYLENFYIQCEASILTVFTLSISFYRLQIMLHSHKTYLITLKTQLIRHFINFIIDVNLASHDMSSLDYFFTKFNSTTLIYSFDLLWIY
jgi:hypothetical protein